MFVECNVNDTVRCMPPVRGVFHSFVKNRYATNRK